MTADQPWSPNSGFQPMPEDRSRLIVDDRGVEWEVYDEATWSIGLALEWDYLPQIENPGLVFVSRVDRRRIWPCPVNWVALSEPELLELLSHARSIV